jgi:predicted PurR-regulated permease PerM
MSGSGASTGVRPKDVWTVVWVLLATAIALYLLYEVRRILIWLVIAVFFAAVLAPAVALLERRGFRRGVAVTVVALALLLVLGGVAYALVRPLVSQSIDFAQDLPETVDRIRQAPIVRQTLERFNIESRIEQVSTDLPNQLVGLSGPLLSAFRTAGELIVGLITILVMTVFLLLYGPQFVRTGLDLVPDAERRQRLERVGGESLRAVSGWVAGNIVTSVIAAVAALIVFLILDMPYGLLLALWVGIADLIPLVGATLGAIPAIIVGFTVSIPAGIIVTVFFIAYQQFENHVLQPAIYGRTIKLNPFLVLVAVLLGVELAGFIGALLALPVAGIVQIVVIEALEHRDGRLVTASDRSPGSEAAHDRSASP